MANENEVKLHEVEMNAPVEVEIKVHCMVPSLVVGAMKSAHLTFYLEPGSIPTKAKIQAVVDSVVGVGAAEIPAGTRLMNKREFVEHITKRETGQAIQMPGNSEFVRATGEIPREMILHAILGAGIPEDLTRATYAKYLETGDILGPFQWGAEAFAKLDADELLALYREITAE